MLAPKYELGKIVKASRFGEPHKVQAILVRENNTFESLRIAGTLSPENSPLVHEATSTKSTLPDGVHYLLEDKKGFYQEEDLRDPNPPDAPVPLTITEKEAPFFLLFLKLFQTCPPEGNDFFKASLKQNLPTIEALVGQIEAHLVKQSDVPEQVEEAPHAQSTQP
jgi:hypothetical protein